VEVVTNRRLNIAPSDTCKVPTFFSGMIADCNDFYSWSKEERNDFAEGWSDPEQVNDTDSKETDVEKLSSPWHYQSVMEASSFPYMGKLSSYRGGGFIVELAPDKVTALHGLQDLEARSWIDRYSRALFAELSIYNVNINLLCVVTLLYEELPTGGGETFVNIQTIRVYRYLGNFSAALMACEVIFAFLLLRWIVRDGKRLWKERKAFWKRIWNIVDIAVTSLSLTALVLYFSRLVFLNSAIDQVRQNRSQFVSFQYVVLLNEAVNAMIAFVVFLLNLKFLRMLRFNRKISVLSSTMKASANKLASFMVMFLVIFMAYCFLVWLVFGNTLADYRTIIRCMVSMMAMVLGNFEFYDLVDVNRIFGPTVFFTFMVIFQFIIINMFIGILCESFNEVRTDAVKQSNEYEILQFMSNRIKAFIGLFVEPPIRPEYNWPKSNLEKKVETIEEKADTTMFFMRNLCAEDVRQMKWFEPGKWSRNKSIVLSLVLNANAEIMENDLCDGVEAMNAAIKKYSESELDRMLLASRMRRNSSAFSQNAESTSTDDDDSEDSETEDQDSDSDDADLKNAMTEESSQENMLEDAEREKEEEVEEEEELMERIEEEFEENDEDEDEGTKESEKCSEMEWEEEIELQLESIGSLPSDNSTASMKGFSPSMPKNRRRTRGSIDEVKIDLGNKENIGCHISNSSAFLRGVSPSMRKSRKGTECSIFELESNLDTKEVNGSHIRTSTASLRSMSPLMPKSRRRTQVSTVEPANLCSEENSGFRVESRAGNPTASGLLSVEVPDMPTQSPPACAGNFEDCTTIFIKEADDESIHSEA